MNADDASKKAAKAEELLKSLLIHIGFSGGSSGGDVREGLSPSEEDGDEYRAIVGSRPFRNACRFFGWPIPKKPSRGERII